MRIALASASPRRRDILQTLGFDVAVVPVDVDELPERDEDPEAYVERVVTDKLVAALARPWCEGCDVLLVADTIVVLDGSILQKPASVDDGRRMLQRLSGRAHEVTTRFAMARPDGAIHAQSVTTRVWFRALDLDDVEAYLASGEGVDKAGGYAIQGRGAALVSRIEGSYGAVVGLPAADVVMALRALLSRG